MKLIIAGGRNYRFTDEDWDSLEALHKVTPITEVVCGGAEGADEYGRQWAILNDIPVKMFPANWDQHGKSAGPIRNREMAEYADAVVLFPGGKGTQSMCENAVKHGLSIYDRR